MGKHSLYCDRLPRGIGVGGAYIYIRPPRQATGAFIKWKNWEFMVSGDGYYSLISLKEKCGKIINYLQSIPGGIKPRGAVLAALLGQGPEGGTPY